MMHSRISQLSLSAALMLFITGFSLLSLGQQNSASNAAMPTSVNFGQDEAKPAGQMEWMLAKWQLAPLRNFEFRLGTNRPWDLRPTLNWPRNATDLNFPDLLRYGTINSGVRFLSLERIVANEPTFPLRSINRTNQAASRLSGPLRSAAMGPLTFTCPSGGTCWVGGASGVWSNSVNWSNGAPTSSTDVLIDNNNANGQGASAVALDISGAQANNLTVDSDDSLSFNTGTSLTVNGGTISNAGQMVINSSSNSSTSLILGANTAVQGGGTTTLNTVANNGGEAYIQGDGFTLTNNSTIQGDGVIGNGSLALVNQAGAIIDANSAGGTAQLQLYLNGSGNITNAGLLEATNSGVLVISNTVNNKGGNITANGASAVVQLAGADVQGGTLNSLNGGSLVTPTGNSATLDGTSNGALTLSSGSTYTGQSGSTTNVLGVINNNGNFQFTGANNANAVFNLAGDTTLQGGGKGTVTLSSAGGGQAYIQGNGFTLTNLNNTIQGSGVIGNGSLSLNNSGTLFANVSGQTLLINAGGSIINNGTMQVASGAAMHITNGAFTNFSGNTLNGGTYNVSGTLQIDELGNGGGEITTNAASIVLNGASSSFVDASGKNALSNLNTNAATGAFTVMGGRTFTTAGTFTNNGTLTVGSSSSKFTVNGNLTNFDGTTDTLTGGTYNLTGKLQFNGANIVTNDANITLSGASSQIVSQNGANGLANFAVNDDLGAFTINNGRNFTTAGTFTNNGVLTVGSSNSKFTVNGSLTNFDTTTGILTGGIYNLTGALQFNGANITATDGADITLSGTSSKIVNQSGANALASFSLNDTGSTFTINSGRNFTTGGNFTNNGTLAVGSSNSKFTVNGSLANFNSTSNTLTGGTYNLTGALQFNGANIVTNAASITLIGASSKIVNQTGGNGLANFATNASGGSFTVAGGRVFTTLGAFTNNGSLTATGSGSDFTTGGSASFINDGTLTATGGAKETATGASGRFTNNGTLIVGTGSTFSTRGSLTNFSGTTLSGGAYNVSGTFQFAGANIVTNAANIVLTGASSQILNSSNGANALANFANNASTGVFSLQGGRSFTTSGAFSNAGNLVIGSGSNFTVGGTGMFTQTRGITVDDGTLTLPSSGTFTLQGGSLFGTGTITGALASSGTITPGDFVKPGQTGILTDTGSYTQNSTGILDIGIKGTTSGTQYDQLNSTTANLNGTLNINLFGFVPSVGSTFDIMNFSSESGQFSTVNGLAINSQEHFTITYQGTDVLLTVVSGPCCAPQGSGQLRRAVGPSHSVAELGRLHLGLRGMNWKFPYRNLFDGHDLAPLASERLLARRASFIASPASTRSPGVVGFPGMFKFSRVRGGFGTQAVAMREDAVSVKASSNLSRASVIAGLVPQALSLQSATRFQTNPGSPVEFRTSTAAQPSSQGFVMHTNGPNYAAAFSHTRGLSVATTPYGFTGVGASHAFHNRMSPAGAFLRNNGHSSGMTASRSMAYHLNLLSILGTNPRQSLRDLWKRPGNDSRLGYFIFDGF